MTFSPNLAQFMMPGQLGECLPPVLVIMNVGVILREERYLERKFGEAYHE